jgi:hypothetical protein
MREMIEIPAKDARPDMDSILKNLEIPSENALPENVKQLLKKAMKIFLEQAQPNCLFSEISIPEFETVYYGEGQNEKATPVNQIFRKADSLALFALTIGQKISEEIKRHFEAKEFALGSVLDAVASAGIDRAADSMENYYLRLLEKEGKTKASKGIIRYNPGYCGWHISGQKKLFEFLHPEDIGIELMDSFLMKPLKSISGVMVFGEKKIHVFKDSYPFCSQCKTRSCRDRIKALFRETQTNKRGVE